MRRIRHWLSANRMVHHIKSIFSFIPGIRTIARQGMRVYRRFIISFRYKLLLLVLLPLLVFIPLILMFTLHRSYSFAQNQLFNKVKTDINIAASSFNHQEKKYLDAITQLAESHAFYTAMQKHNARRIQNLLNVLRVTEGMDFVHIVNLQGLRMYDDAVFSHKTHPDRMVSNVIHNGQPQVGLELYSPAYLFRELDFQGNDQTSSMFPSLVDSLQSKSEKVLVIFSAYPIKNNQGQTIALLEGGVLINGNTSLINAISSMVYGNDTPQAANNGLISIIIDNRRITTSLQSKTDTTLSPITISHLRKTVLDKNRQWVGEIHTSNGVYLSGYQPLKDYQGHTIGILETGYLAAPLRRAYQNDLILTALLLLAAMLGAAVIAFFAARRIFKPIERIAEVIYAQEQGRNQRIGKITSQDEIGAMAKSFDHMLDMLHERNAEIQRAANNLEQQVANRTRELLQKNAELQKSIDLLSKTRQQLVWAEKFAALGELTAGIAHEINNPTAVIMGNMDILRDELSDKLAPFDTEVTLIYEQITRIRSIIDNLLKYSRSSPMSQNLQTVNVNELISGSLLLIRHEAVRKHAVIETEFEPECHVQIDPQELQQVLINLLVNALHAIDMYGSIKINTSRLNEEYIRIEICDNGQGVDPDSLDRIFDPFYTTKGNDGNGLGLSISYGLIARYGGHLEVDSSSQQGTTFSILLRRRAKLSPQRQLLFELYSKSISTRSQ